MERTDNNYHKADNLQTSVSLVVSFILALVAENIPANVALESLAWYVHVNVVLQADLGRVRLVAVRAMVPASFCYEKVTLRIFYVRSVVKIILKIGQNIEKVMQ